MSININMASDERIPVKDTSPGIDIIMLCIGMILVMLRSHRIIYVRGIDEVLIYGLGFFCFVVYLICNYKKLEKLSVFSSVAILLVSAFYVYDRLRVSVFTPGPAFCLLTTILGCALIIQAPLRDKQYVYRSFLVTVEVIVGIALFGWILMLLGVPLPSYYDNEDVFYSYQNYYIFNINLNGDDINLDRFSGPFLEPGHNATMCVFLLYINRFNLKNKGNWILLLSALFSLSLAGYGLLIGAVLITLLYKRMYLVTIVSAAAFIGIGVGSAYYLKGENPVYEIVFSRLELDESGDDIVGNNRTTSFFDMTYDKFMKSNDIWTGIGRRAFGTHSDGSDNVTIGSAGYKRYFLIRGIIGAVLIAYVLLYYTWHYRSRITFGFLVIYVVANIIRDYPGKEIWMYLFLMAIPLIYYNMIGPVNPKSGDVKKKKYIGNC